MPTRDQRRFAALAIRYFQRQDYEPRELIIVDDGADPVEDLIPHDERYRYIRLRERLSTGARRNLACEEARGAILIHWDDDVWYAPRRISSMVAELLSRNADVCGLNAVLAYDPRTSQGTRYSELPRMHGSSLCYRRAVWEQHRFEDVNRDESIAFLSQVRHGRRVPARDSACQVVIRHDSAALAGVPGEPWPLGEVRRLMEEDWSYYESEIACLPAPQAAPAPLPRCVPTRPPVSCIMPTYNRRRFVPLAIHYFLRQDYEPKELVIVDDGTDAIEDLVPADDRIRYFRLEQKIPVGAKRNLACEHARGEIILHWDDDDWQAPQRISRMVEALLAKDLDLCGLNPVLFYDLGTSQAFQYRYPPDRFWVHGSSFCYRRAFWETHRFAEIDVGEDNQFIWSTASARMAALAESDCHVSMIHEANVSPKTPVGQYWEPYRAIEIRRLLGVDWGEYERFSGNGEVNAAAPLRIDRVGIFSQDAAAAPAACTVIAVLSNSLTSARLITLRTLRHLAGRDARLLVVDDGSDDGTEVWLTMLARRGDIDLVRSERALGRESAVALGCARTRSPLVVVLGPDSFPVCDQWLEVVRHAAGEDATAPAGRDLIRGSCVLTMRGDAGGLRFATIQSDGPLETIQQALEREAREAVEMTVVVNVGSAGPDRRRNLDACLRAFNYQDLERWRYRIVVVEQDEEPRLEQAVAPLADRYLFAYNPGLYSNSWPRNLGAAAAAGQGVLCFADTDLLAQPAFLRSALDRVSKGDKALVYDWSLYLDPASTEQAIRDRLAAPLTPLCPDRYSGRRVDGAFGLVTCVEARFFERLGGYDERFRGWGGEDTELNDRITRLCPPGHFSGAALHMDHMRSSAFYWTSRNPSLCQDIMAGRVARYRGPIGDPDQTAREAGFSSLTELHAVRGAASIPRHAFLIWISDQPLPARLERYTRTWERLGLEIRRVTLENLEPDNAYLRHCLDQRKYVHASDYLRLWYLFRYGGLYLDNDVEVLRPFDDLLSNRLFFGAESAETVATGVIGARPGQGLLKLMTDIIEQRGSGDAANENGPVLLTRLLRDRGWQGGDTDTFIDGITIYSSRRFYPYSWTEQFTPACITAGTYSVHHWCRSWLAPGYARDPDPQLTL